MIRFQEIYYLYALAIVPVIILLFIAALFWRRRKLKKLGDERLVGGQMLGFIPGRSTSKFILLMVALSAMIIGWANLQTGDKVEKVERKGVDVVIALDVSKSMLATDIQPDRLTRAKLLIMQMADKMHNDRVAFIVFAGRAYLQVPLTIDYSTLKMMVQNVSTKMVPTQGTVIGEAIDMAITSFSQTERKYKSLIIISDGEDHDEKAAEKIKEAANAGIIVHTVGIGSPQGTTLFDPETNSVKLDDNGSPVISKLNETELKSLAAAGGGTYSLLTNSDEVASKLISNLEGMEQKNLGSVVFADFTSYFQYFLLLAFIALLIEWLLPGAKLKAKKIIASDAPGAKEGDRKKIKLVDVNIKTRVILIIAVTVAATLPAVAQTNQLLQQGNQLYSNQRYDEAAANYMKALQKDPGNATGLFNLGNALYQNKKYDSSRKIMATTAGAIKDKGGKAAANYNIGNTYMAQRNWDEAIASYKNTLRNNPQDADAKYNLSYAEQMKKQDEKKGGGKNDKKDQKDKKDQQKDKQQQDKDNKDKNKDKDKQDQQDKDNKDKQDNKDQQPQSQPSKLSQQQADQLLNALQQEEKKLQDKLKKEKAIPLKLDKDW